jgi:hypothetical protein
MLANPVQNILKKTAKEVEMKENRRGKDLGKEIESMIRSFINESPENAFGNRRNEKAWEDPLVGFSNGADPLYEEYKEYVGTFHWTPLEIFTNTFPQVEITAGELTVISWVLPQTEMTKSDNRKSTRFGVKNIPTFVKSYS